MSEKFVEFNEKFYSVHCMICEEKQEMQYHRYLASIH